MAQQRLEVDLEASQSVIHVFAVLPDLWFDHGVQLRTVCAVNIWHTINVSPAGSHGVAHLLGKHVLVFMDCETRWSWDPSASLQTVLST